MYFALNWLKTVQTKLGVRYTRDNSYLKKPRIFDLHKALLWANKITSFTAFRKKIRSEIRCMNPMINLNC